MGITRRICIGVIWAIVALDVTVKVLAAVSRVCPPTANTTARAPSGAFGAIITCAWIWLPFVTVADCRVIPALGVNCSVAGDVKFAPASVNATVVPCVPCTGVNPRSAGCAFGAVPQAVGESMPGGQLLFAAAVIVNGVEIFRSWSASTSITVRLPGWAFAAI